MGLPKKVRSRFPARKTLLVSVKVVWGISELAGLPGELEISNIPDVTDSSLEKYLITSHNSAFYRSDSRILFVPISCLT
jgi:hypothetical protein